MIAKHVYMKGRNGWGIFYRIEDCLVYFTIYSVLVRQMNLCVLAFSIMFNHTHSLLKSIIEGRLSRFQHRLGSIFAHEYNAEYERTGPVFKSPYGESDKRGVKNIISAIAYNANNPVAGKMCKKAAENMWTLLAYYNNPNPFSKKLVKRESRHVMRDALKIVDLYYSKGKHLGYAVLRRIYARLDIEEKRQMTDYIIYKYNFLSYKDLIEIFNSFDKALETINTIAGNEYELEDEYGDHSNYQKMLALSRQMGFEGPNYEKLSPQQIRKISSILYAKINPTTDQMRKFLHLPMVPVTRPVHPVPRK